MSLTHCAESVRVSCGDLNVVRLAERGRPLLVVHGGPDWDHSYLIAAVAPLVDHGVAPILFDLRGCGASMRLSDPAGYKVSLVVQDIAELLDALGLASVDLLGFSFGGVVAQEFFAAHPARVERLILASTAYPVELPTAAADLAGECSPISVALRERMQWLFHMEPDPQTASRVLASETMALDVHQPQSLPVARRLIAAVAFSGEWMRAFRLGHMREQKLFHPRHLAGRQHERRASDLPRRAD
ncbi:alpha/beta fold hydrolase [Rhodoferax sp.]|uniref:alpha/beta fold hydrolase n=1 Tax=Rhodoferax sp. TaxID=50421 RepID=UPI0027582AAB|nr:alpha/beta fold hydrolase [Rhodoferax sp.]